MEELTTAPGNISEDAAQLMKFHGSYQQDDREKRGAGRGKAYQFMMRTRQPAGRVSNGLYLTMDDLADHVGNGTLRLTTRQAYQLHGVLKGDLKTAFSSVVKAMGSTLGACGDVNRNVCAPAAPFSEASRPDYAACARLAEDVADLLAPQSGAYYDVWLDGEKFASSVFERPEVTAARDENEHGTNFVGSPEPIYGAQFLPRKFKVAVTVPGDNSVDLFTNDLGLVVIMDPQNPGEVLGADVVAGGGMGRSHRAPTTYPRLADPIGFVPRDRILAAVKAIVATQRDYGRRDDRRQARLKYLIDEWGVDRFRSTVEQYLGHAFEPFRALPAWKEELFLGWTDQGDGRWSYGIHVPGGRIKGEGKKTLRSIIEREGIPVVITAQQNLVLSDIDPSKKSAIQAELAAAGLAHVDDVDFLDANSLACPALPLCGLAVTEAERALPSLHRRVRSLMTSMGFAETEGFALRVTGCPNGCARPYAAEIGLVGDGPNSYQLWVGGSAAGTRLNELYLDRVKVQKLESTLEPLLAHWRSARRPGETLGDCCARAGTAALREFAKGFVSENAGGESESLPKVSLPVSVFEAVSAAAEAQGKSPSHVAAAALIEKFGGGEDNNK